MTTANQTKSEVLEAFKKDFPYYYTILKGNTATILAVLNKLTEVFSLEINALNLHSSVNDYQRTLHKLKPHIKSIGEEIIYNKVVKEEISLKSNNLISKRLKELFTEISLVINTLKQKVKFYEQNL